MRFIFLLLFELKDLLFLGCNSLAELLDDMIHVFDLSLNLRDDIGLGLLKENAIDKAPAFAGRLQVLDGVHHEFMLLLLLLDLENFGDEG